MDEKGKELLDAIGAELVEFSNVEKTASQRISKAAKSHQTQLNASDAEMLAAVLAVALNYASRETQGETWDDVGDHLKSQISRAIGLIE